MPDGRNILIDNRDNIAAWCIVFYNRQVIGGARVCRRDSQGLFEVQAYKTGQSFDELMREQRHPNMVELTRGVVDPTFVRFGIFRMMLKTMFEYCSKYKLSALTAPSNKSVINTYNKIEFPDSKRQFKFEPQDPEPAQLFIAYHELGQIDKIFESLKKLVEERQSRLILPLAPKT